MSNCKRLRRDKTGAFHGVLVSRSTQTLNPVGHRLSAAMDRSLVIVCMSDNVYHKRLCLQDDERIDPELETMFEAGVDEMSWDSVVSVSSI